MAPLSLLTALPLIVASAPCPGGDCKAAEIESDSALLQTRRARAAGESAGHPNRHSDRHQPVSPERAVKRSAERRPLVLEKNLEPLTHQRASSRKSTGDDTPVWKGGQKCSQAADQLFQEVVAEAGLAAELTKAELKAFRDRFSTAMVQNCKNIQSEQEWLHAAGKEFERQKPIMTAALAASLNKAELGFKTEMRDWLIYESWENFGGRLGLLETPADQESVLKRKPESRRTSEQLPETFRAEDKWPTCKEAILKIHNQGHCGSCWAFGALASIDSRMCIASDGTWTGDDDILSRLYAASCALEPYEPGGDGCQGGLPHWPMEMMASSKGMVSTSCLPYYIGGEGSEHFEQKDSAPPCDMMTHCQGGYSLSMDDDRYHSAGIANYDWITQVHGDADKMAMMKTAIYNEGPVSFAFKANHAFMGYSEGVFSVCDGTERANHAVYAFGWGVLSGVEFVEASNSWGTGWGDGGHFKIHPLCVTDVTISGSIESDVVSHDVGTVQEGVPADPDNEFWPWRKPMECPFVDGCVTDMEGDGDYADNEECVSSKLNGRRIKVVQFETEAHYDIVTVNSHDYSGSGEGLDGQVVGDSGIKFKSDFSQTAAGFKLCSEEIPECPFVDGCVTDLEGDGDYSVNEMCVSDKLNGKTINVVAFNTEAHYDIVTINGHGYSGTEVPSSLQGSTVDDNGIKFKSDFSENAPGFKICAV